ncbi:hypothetical protein GCM10009535_16130 [Streptomyces thermocarboxydovorans]|uniref:Secreted protein n=1 Tax=Streptomyces thermocarboxydovorans TaxID=59298 RepID=A0ABP3SHV9_9ACTN
MATNATATRDRTWKTGTHRRPVPGAALAVLAALTLAVAGCGGPDEKNAEPSDARGASTPAASASPSGGRDGTAAGPAVTAADGDDTGACSDGDCEITVSEPVTIRFPAPGGGRATLTVTGVGPDEIQYSVKSGGSRSEAGAGGPGQGCITVLRSHGSGNSCGRLGDSEPPAAQPDAVVIQAATGRNGTVLLQIVSR